MKIILIMVVFFCTACTYSITMVHTEGMASDVLDETATNTPTTNISLPASVIPRP